MSKSKNINQKRARKIRIGDFVEVRFDGDVPGSNKFEVGIVTEIDDKIAINAIEKLISLYDMQFGGDVGKFFIYDTQMKRIAESDLLEFTPQVVSEFSDAAWRRGFFFGQAGVHFVFAKMEEVRRWRLLPENVVAAIE